MITHKRLRDATIRSGNEDAVEINILRRSDLWDLLTEPVPTALKGGDGKGYQN